MRDATLAEIGIVSRVYGYQVSLGRAEAIIPENLSADVADGSFTSFPPFRRVRFAPRADVRIIDTLVGVVLGTIRLASYLGRLLVSLGRWRKPLAARIAMYQ